MAFKNIIGQQRIVRFLQRILQSGRISHAYLFVGEKGVGKEAVAFEYCKGLLCGEAGNCETGSCPDCGRIARFCHPDVHFIFPAPAKVKEEDQHKIIASVVRNPYKREELWANPSISIEKIREIRKKASFKSFEGKGQVVIIVDCERMTVEAANALLKILEEPPDKMFLLMTSSKPNLLLPTITSRCQVVKFDPLSTKEIENALVQNLGIDSGRARLAARISSGSYRRALDFVDHDMQSLQEQALEMFRKCVQNDFKQMSYVDELLSKAQRDTKSVKELLQFLTLWFRDAMIYRETAVETAHVINEDQMEVLKNFTGSFPNADLHGAVDEIEKSLWLFDRNVQVNLILIVLLGKLRSLVRR